MRSNKTRLSRTQRRTPRMIQTTRTPRMIQSLFAVQPEEGTFDLVKPKYDMSSRVDRTESPRRTTSFVMSTSEESQPTTTLGDWRACTDGPITTASPNTTTAITSAALAQVFKELHMSKPHLSSLSDSCEEGINSLYLSIEPSGIFIDFAWRIPANLPSTNQLAATPRSAFNSWLLIGRKLREITR